MHGFHGVPSSGVVESGLQSDRHTFPFVEQSSCSLQSKWIAPWPSAPCSGVISVCEASRIHCRIDLWFYSNVCEVPINTLCGSLKCLGGEVKEVLSALTSLGCTLCLASRRALAPKICGSGEFVARLQTLILDGGVEGMELWGHLYKGNV